MVVAPLIASGSDLKPYKSFLDAANITEEEMEAAEKAARPKKRPRTEGSGEEGDEPSGSQKAVPIDWKPLCCSWSSAVSASSSLVALGSEAGIIVNEITHPDAAETEIATKVAVCLRGGGATSLVFGAVSLRGEPSVRLVSGDSHGCLRVLLLSRHHADGLWFLGIEREIAPKKAYSPVSMMAISHRHMMVAALRGVELLVWDIDKPTGEIHTVTEAKPKYALSWLDESCVAVGHHKGVTQWTLGAHGLVQKGSGSFSSGATHGIAVSGHGIFHGQLKRYTGGEEKGEMSQAEIKDLRFKSTELSVGPAPGARAIFESSLGFLLDSCVASPSVGESSIPSIPSIDRVSLMDLLSYIKASKAGGGDRDTEETQTMFRNTASSLAEAFRASVSEVSVRVGLAQLSNSILRAAACSDKESLPAPTPQEGEAQGKEGEGSAAAASTEPASAGGFDLEEDSLLMLHIKASLLSPEASTKPSIKHLVMLDWATSKVPKQGETHGGDPILSSLLTTCRAVASLPAFQELNAPPPGAFDTASKDQSWIPSPRESCPLCKSPVAMSGDPHKARCEAGHVLERCVFDLTLVSTPKLDRCPVCSRCTPSADGNTFGCIYDMGRMRPGGA